MIIKSLIILFISLVVYCFELYLGNKKHQFSSAILFVLIYFMVAGNFQNADTYSSELTYNKNINQVSIQLFGQWAYYLVINFCNFLHLTFIQYRFVVYGIGFVVLLIASLRVLHNVYPFLVLYILFPMIIDATQLKNFVAMCFITLAVTFLVSGNRKDKLIFILLIIFAAGFHVVSFVYLPLVIVCDSSVKNRTKYLSVAPIVLFALLFSNRKMSSLLSVFILSNMSDSLANRAQAFFNSRVNLGYLVYFLATFVFIFIVFRLRRNIINNSNSDEKDIKFANIVFYCSIFSLVFLPFYYLRQDFSRLLRNLFPIFHLCFVMFFSIENRAYSFQREKFLTIRVTYEKTILFCSYILGLIYMFFWDIYGYLDSVIIPFFQFNAVL